jgi:enoyl-CoA hydratase
MYDDYQRLLFSRRGRVLTITMNRPEARNAADMRMHNELSRVFRDVAKDPETAVVVLTGAGQAFSAGGDVIAMREKIDNRSLWVQTVNEAREIFYGMLDLEKPIIARVNGHASGLGATLAVYSDIVVAVEGAKFADPHVKVGLVAGDGGALMWPMLIGVQKAKEYLFLGDQITAREAERLGLINYCVDPSTLDAKVEELADRLASGASQAIGWTKLAINMSLRQLALSSMEMGFGLETLSQMTADHDEAVRAFAEKREPNFHKDAVR